MNSTASLRFQRFDLPGGLELSVLPTRKLKTVIVQAHFSSDLDEGVSARALLPEILFRGTEFAPDLQAVQRRCEELYGAALGSSVLKVGEWHGLKFRLEAVNGQFLPGDDDVFRDSLAFFRELIFQPRLDSAGNFPVEEFRQEKEKHMIQMEICRQLL